MGLFDNHWQKTVGIFHTTKISNTHQPLPPWTKPESTSAEHPKGPPKSLTKYPPQYPNRSEHSSICHRVVRAPHILLWEYHSHYTPFGKSMWKMWRRWRELMSWRWRSWWWTWKVVVININSFALVTRQGGIFTQRLAGATSTEAAIDGDAFDAAPPTRHMLCFLPEWFWASKKEVSND